MAAIVTDAELLESRHVARALGIATETLRAWERRQVIPRALRTSGGRRVYRPEDVALIRERQATRQATRQPQDAA
jgi:DNA-binding transcriptional MerR regulator